MHEGVNGSIRRSLSVVACVCSPNDSLICPNAQLTTRNILLKALMQHESVVLLETGERDEEKRFASGSFAPCIDIHANIGDDIR